MGSGDSPAVAGRYQRVLRAPAGLRAVVKAGELDRMIGAVDEWRDLQAKLDAARAELVRELRGRGGSWDAIGWLLGVTGTAVRKRYGPDVP